MPISAILDAVRTIVGTAAGVPAGTLHKGIRWADQDADFRTLLRDAPNARLHSWQVTTGGQVTDVAGDGANATRNLALREWTIRVIGIYAIDDDPTAATVMPSEEAFLDVAEAVVTAITQNHTLTGTVMDSGPASMPIFEARAFRGDLVHYCEIEFEAVERVIWA